MATLTAGRPPVRLTSLVGRASELRDVRQELATSRLLTLTGPGGTGKTRLALAAAAVAGDSFPGGICWVELAPAGDSAIVGQTVASQLGAPDTPGQDAAEAIADHVDGRRTLIVLDNCEHLAAAVASLAERLLVACPALSILATSREPLGVEGECSWPVPPLSLPPGGAVVTATAAALAGRTRCASSNSGPSWCGRRSVSPTATPPPCCRSATAWTACAAIELAAARIRILPAAQLAERLDDIFAVLTGGARNAPRRHQALRATLDWSYDLLTADERAVFRRLAAFSGGFTLPAAEQVTGRRHPRPGHPGPADPAGRKVAAARGAAGRRRALPPARHHPRLRAGPAGGGRRGGTGAGAHLRYFTELAEQVGPLVEHGESPQALEGELDRLDTERPNLRAALDFARQSGSSEAALRLAGQLGRYADPRGHYHEIRQWMDEAVLDGADAPAALRAKALLGSGLLALLQCDYAPAVRRLHAALRLYRELGDPGASPARCRCWAVSPASRAATPGRRGCTESLAIAAASGDGRAVASVHGYLGFVSWLQGGFGRATEECTAALEQVRELGDVEGTAWSLLSLGDGGPV